MRTLKKIFFPLFLILCISTALNSQTKLTSEEEGLFKDILEIRLQSRTFSDGQKASEFIEENYNKIKNSQQYKNLSEELVITVDNLFINANYNALYEFNPNDPKLKTIMVDQYYIIDRFRSLHQKDTFNKYFYVSSGDLINSTMQFLQQTHAIKLGLQEKADYDSLLEREPTFSFGYLNAALWYYYAPSIGGGSKKKAREYFIKATVNAKTNFEKYYSNIFLSQIYYEAKDTANYERCLVAAESALLGTRYISFIKMLNEKNISLMYYTNNREKVEKKLGL